MDKTVMAALIVAGIKAQNPLITSTQEAELKANWEAICDGIIKHIIAAAVVQVSTGSGSGGIVS